MSFPSQGNGGLIYVPQQQLDATPRTPSAKGAIRGVVGEIKWSYFSAATIRGYTVRTTASGGRLVATVVSSDAFNIHQRQLVFVAPHEKGEWRWPIVEMQISGGSVGTVTATLGPLVP